MIRLLKFFNNISYFINNKHKNLIFILIIFHTIIKSIIQLPKKKKACCSQALTQENSKHSAALCTFIRNAAFDSHKRQKKFPAGRTASQVRPAGRLMRACAACRRNSTPGPVFSLRSSAANGLSQFLFMLWCKYLLRTGNAAIWLCQLNIVVRI